MSDQDSYSDSSYENFDHLSLNFPQAEESLVSPYDFGPDGMHGLITNYDIGCKIHKHL